jgi:hypothetical protein
MKASASSQPSRWIPASGRKLNACASPTRRPFSPAKATSTASKASRRLSAKWVDDRLVLSFRDGSGHTGTLSLARPGTMSVFEVDPRDRPDKGQGPRLYKEWKLSASAAGSGVFAPGIGPRQTLTLILQGSGNSCTSAIDFSHWTLMMQGPKANYTLFGDLVR